MNGSLLRVNIYDGQRKLLRENNLTSLYLYHCAVFHWRLRWYHKYVFSALIILQEVGYTVGFLCTYRLLDMGLVQEAVLSRLLLSLVGLALAGARQWKCSVKYVWRTPSLSGGLEHPLCSMYILIIVFLRTGLRVEKPSNFKCTAILQSN